MEYSDSDLQKYQKIAFDYALYRTGNIHAAEDISSQTISLFLLSFNNSSDARRWIINTSKNYCNKFFTKMKKDEKRTNTYKEDILQRISNQSGYEKDDSLHDAFKESFKSLNDMELKTIFYYFQCNENIKEMHNNIGSSYATVRKQISRIKNKLKAETYRNLGFIGTKMIVTPQLDNLIYQFLLRFKKNLENNTLEKMHYYFSEVDLKNYNPIYEIKEIIEYDIELSDSIYKAWVFYKNKHNEVVSFHIEFFVDDKNHLKIVTPPTKTKKIVVINEDSIEGKQIRKLLDTFPIDKSGRPKIPEEEIDKIIKQFEEKQNKE
jgi:hypothetical protein